MSGSGINKSVPSGTQAPQTTSPSQSPRPRYYEKFKLAKLLAEKAMRENRIFTIVGKYPLIRTALRKRGWVEKTYCGESPASVRRRKRRHLKSCADSCKIEAIPAIALDCSDDNDDETKTGDCGDIGKRLLDIGSSLAQVATDSDDINAEDDLMDIDDINSMMSRMVRKAPPNFIWTCRRDCIYFKRIRRNQLVNHFPTADFTTKVGLNNCLQDVRWYAEVDVRSFFPRCYCIGVEEEKLAFIEDFRLTACLGILKWVVSFVQSTKITNFTLPINCLRVPVRVGEVALQQCEAFLRCKNHEDIDFNVNIPMNDDQWSVVLDWYYQLVHKNALMIQAESIHDRCLKMLKRMRPYWPQMELDGMHNVWIVKPGAKSRGIGIMILERLDDITNLVDSQVVVKTTKYVVQKYIERPYLIYNTKFDIRQWFMVTDWNPLTIYFYKDCYLRFCSRYFSLTDKSEAVHLCNNAVQRRYMHEDRESIIPKYAMWSSDEFKEFLRKKGKSLMWDKVIYPGMKEAVTATMSAAQEITDNKKGCFELYGADFMLTENFRPWLLEINSSPCLAPTTQVTARLCANVLEDAIKVLIDRRMDKNADIGQFEVAFRQAPLTLPPYIGINLFAQGTAIIRPPNARPNDGTGLDQFDHRERRRPKSRTEKTSKTKLSRDSKTRESSLERPRTLRKIKSVLRTKSNNNNNNTEDKSVVFVHYPKESSSEIRPGSRTSSLHIEQLYAEEAEANKLIPDENSNISNFNTEYEEFERRRKRNAREKRDPSNRGKREEFPTLSFITLSPWHSPSSNVVPSNWNPYTWYQLPTTLQTYLQDLDKKRYKNNSSTNNTNRNHSNSVSPYSVDSDTTDNYQNDSGSGPHIVPMTY